MSIEFNSDPQTFSCTRDMNSGKVYLTLKWNEKSKVWKWLQGSDWFIIRFSYLIGYHVDVWKSFNQSTPVNIVRLRNGKWRHQVWGLKQVLFFKSGQVIFKYLPNWTRQSVTSVAGLEGMKVLWHQFGCLYLKSHCSHEPQGYSPCKKERCVWHH